MRPAINLFVEVRAVVLACAVMAALNFAGCTPTPVTPSASDSAPASVSVPSVTIDAVPSADLALPQVVQAAPIVTVVPVMTVDSADTQTVVTSTKEPHPRAGQYKRTLIQQSHYVWGLNAPIASFAAQIHQESRWNASARSPVGAAGLTQFMPATAQWISGMDGELKSGDVFNPKWAMRALVVYDKFLYSKVSAVNPCERLAFAMSAYNGGLGWVNKRKARSSNPDVCFGATCEINPGVSAASQRENAGYPKVILKTFEPMYIKAGWGQGVCYE